MLKQISRQPPSSPKMVSTNEKATQAISFFVLVAVSRTLVTKWLLSGEDAFAYPVVYSSISCLSTMGFIGILVALGNVEINQINRSQLASFAWVAGLTAVDMGATNIAVEGISLALQQTIKASLPVIVVVLEIVTKVRPTRVPSHGFPTRWPHACRGLCA